MKFKKDLKDERDRSTGFWGKKVLGRETASAKALRQAYSSNSQVANMAGAKRGIQMVCLVVSSRGDSP